MPVTARPLGRSALVAVLTVTLLVFAIVVAYITLWLRSGLRDQVLQREAEALTEVASLQLTNEADSLAALGVKDAPGELLNAVLKTSKLRGVFAVRVFDADQRFSGALPIPWSERAPDSSDWAALQAGHPLARLHPRESAADVIGLAPAAAAGRDPQPLLETWLPLRNSNTGVLAGAAQMWTDGNAVAEEFHALDHRLVWQALLAWAAGALIITGLLAWAFRQLARANRQLQARTEDLSRANRELTLAAKTSALGAVTAHLMHELKNPVAGLEEFVASQSDGNGRESGGEMSAAVELTQRLRRMINDVIGVMRDEQTGAHFELTCEEITELALAKVRPAAAARGVRLSSTVATKASLPGRRANLAGLVLQNLLQNAIEASPPDSQVTVTAEPGGPGVRFAVVDAGPGLPAAVQERLFQPCATSKQGGSGLGLALSQQLARQAGGRIHLASTGVSGTCFHVVLDPEKET